MTLSTMLGLLAATLGCVALYLASAHQRWLGRPLPAWPARAAGAALLAAGYFCLQHGMQALAAVFMLATWVMLWLSLLPYLGALLNLYRRQ